MWLLVSLKLRSASLPGMGVELIASWSPALFPIMPPRAQCPPGRMSRAWDAWWPDAPTAVPTLEELRIREQGCG